MGRRNRCKPRMIPQQDKRICGCICFCQLIVVFSCVSLIYLTVAIYIPSYRAFRSGFEETPVMCQTVNTSMLNNCSWASCGEWCLTKTSGFCPQIYATSRQNGTTLSFVNCTSFRTSSCPPANVAALKRHNCNNGTECNALKGLFNCTLGHCSNVSEIFDCQYKADGHTLDTDKDNSKLSGYFECKGSKCTKIKNVYFGCERICKENVTTESQNIFITTDNSIAAMRCSGVWAETKSRGNEPGYRIAATKVWTDQSNETLMVSCYNITHDPEGLLVNGTDCINGTIYNSSTIRKPIITFRQFWKLRGKHKKVLDPTNTFVPEQSNLTIYHNSRLYINLEGCVNTLKGECLQFVQRYGSDGRNQTAQSRYPCFYKKNSTFMVISRYDLQKTWTDLIIAVSVPSFLFAVSFVTLCIIMQSVRVDDDAKMRCKYCFGRYNSNLTELVPANSNKYEVSSPESDEPIMRHHNHHTS